MDSKLQYAYVEFAVSEPGLHKVPAVSAYLNMDSGDARRRHQRILNAVLNESDRGNFITRITWAHIVIATGRLLDEDAY